MHPQFLSFSEHFPKSIKVGIYGFFALLLAGLGILVAWILSMSLSLVLVLWFTL